jgi:hypothetical protein
VVIRQRAAAAGIFTPIEKGPSDRHSYNLGNGEHMGTRNPWRRMACTRPGSTSETERLTQNVVERIVNRLCEQPILVMTPLNKFWRPQYSRIR